MAKQKLKKNLDMTRHLVLQLLKTKIKLDIWRGDIRHQLPGANSWPLRQKIQ